MAGEILEWTAQYEYLPGIQISQILPFLFEVL